VHSHCCFFFVVGLNVFLHFIPIPLPPGVAGQFLGALAASHYLGAVALFQVMGQSFSSQPLSVACEDEHDL
jgi:hypothetical protein